MVRLIAAFLVLIVSVGILGFTSRVLPCFQDQLLPHIDNLPQSFLVDQEGSASDLVVEEVDLSIVFGLGAEPLPSTIIGRTTPLEEANGLSMSGGFRHRWPAVYATARFEGDTILVAFDDPINRYRIELDGGLGPVIQIVKPSAQAFRISGLGPNRHTIRVEKVSESASSAGLFKGFYLPIGEIALAPPAAKERQIEFIGDSDTVGLGNMSMTRDCEGYNVFLEATDTEKAFGPRVAEHFRADYEVIAASGIQLVRSDQASSDQSMLARYPPMTSGDWSPNLVVILIGSNDLVIERPAWHFWESRKLPSEFQDSYVRFLRDIRAQYPEAFLLVLTLEELGPEFIMAHEEINTRKAAIRRTKSDSKAVRRAPPQDLRNDRYQD